MRILFATSECAPFSKSGGLADVAYSLPPALKEAGEEIAIVTPLYQCARKRFGDTMTFVKETTVKVGWREMYCGLFRGEHNGCTVWFIDNEEFFDRPKLYGYDDDALRFAFFSKAVIELIPDYDFVPQIIHCNDWETALVVIYLKDAQVLSKELKNIKTVYTIHNIAYQGQFGKSQLYDTFGLVDGWFDGGLSYIYEGREDINLMKGAMMMADAVTTVSPTYARELHYPQFGCGLQGVVDMIEPKLWGILNGLDVNHYNPEIDPIIPANFTVDDLSGKAKCKAWIQEQFGLKVEAEWPLLASVARLNEQKGIELIKQVLPGLMDFGIQLIVFGQGEPKYVEYFKWAKEQWPEQIGFSDDYTEEMASKIFAGADMYLMPSRFEPCGLSQMMAMRYGTVPIVHETGGLKDSVRPYNGFDGVGDGFAFSNYQAKDLYLAIVEAIKVYFGNPEKFEELRKRDMRKDLSWDKSAMQYQRMYLEIVDSKEDVEVEFEDAFNVLKDAYMNIDKINKEKFPERINKEYHRIIQIHFYGRAEGTIHVEFADGELSVKPNSHPHVDAYIDCSYDNLLGMISGEVSVNKLFTNGQLEITGNLSKGYDIRNVLNVRN